MTQRKGTVLVDAAAPLEGGSGIGAASAWACRAACWPAACLACLALNRSAAPDSAGESWGSPYSGAEAGRQGACRVLGLGRS